MTKTNAMRILDAAGIQYSFYEYKADPTLKGSEIAKILNEDAACVFKTLITVSKSKNYYVFLVPVEKELNLKLAAKAVNEKNVEMIPQKELLKVTGYVHGGCSPIGLKKSYQITIDESCLNFEYIYISAGKVGAQIQLKKEDFINLMKPIITTIIT